MKKAGEFSKTGHRPHPKQCSEAFFRTIKLQKKGKNDNLKLPPKMTDHRCFVPTKATKDSDGPSLFSSGA